MRQARQNGEPGIGHSRSVPAAVLFAAAKDDRSAARAAEYADHVVRVPNIDLTRESQIKLAIMIALSEGLLSPTARLVCAAGIPRARRVDSLVVVDVGTEVELMTPGAEIAGIFAEVKPAVFEATLNTAIELAHQGREGRPIGTVFVLGDHEKVLAYSRQLVFNPFHGYPEDQRNILDPNLKETVKEFAAIDGAFILRGDGVVLSAGRHLNAWSRNDGLPLGLGSRHVAAAGITEVTRAVSVAVSESTGSITIFVGGRIFMTIERPGLGDEEERERRPLPRPRYPTS